MTEADKDLDKLKKDELVKEAEKLGVNPEPGDTKAEILEAVEDKLSGNEHTPEVFMARFDPTDPPEVDPGPVYEY